MFPLAHFSTGVLTFPILIYRYLRFQGNYICDMSCRYFFSNMSFEFAYDYSCNVEVLSFINQIVDFFKCLKSFISYLQTCLSSEKIFSSAFLWYILVYIFIFCFICNL